MNPPLTIKTVLSLLEEATLADPETLAPTTELLAMEGWDSMGMVMFISLVEESHGLKLSIADLRDCTTAQGLCDEIEARFPGQGT